MKHAILGAGAIGGLMGTALSYVGEDVTLILRPEKVAGYPERLTLEQPAQTITAPARTLAKLTEPVDVLWIATKAYQLQAALASIEAVPATVVPLLNGVDHIAVLRSRFGNDHVLPATIAVEADRVADGHFAQRAFVRLNVAGSGERLLAPLLASLQERLGFICNFIANEQTLLWGKLCFLAPFALVTSASRKDKGEIFADPEWKAALDSCAAEAAAVAKAEGAEIDLAKIQRLFDAAPATMRSSMLKDLIARRKLELDAIGGPIVRGGEKHGIPVPTTKALMAAIDGPESVQWTHRAGK